jgi:hypothetical protein
MPTRASLCNLMIGFQHMWSDTMSRVLTCGLLLTQAPCPSQWLRRAVRKHG